MPEEPDSGQEAPGSRPEDRPSRARLNLVERLRDVYDGGESPPAGSPLDSRSLLELVGGLSEYVVAIGRLAWRTGEEVVSAVEAWLPGGMGTRTGGAGTVLVLAPVPFGSSWTTSAEGVVEVDNTSSTPLLARLVATACTFRGHPDIDPRCFHIHPSSFVVPAKGSEKVTVRVTVPVSHQPGQYLGVIEEVNGSEARLPVIVNLEPRTD